MIFLCHMNKFLRYSSASIAGSYLYLSPILAIFIAWLWLDEIPAFLSLMGGFIALLGVMIVNFWGKTP
jgi:drug/metabolite transporter (DMT)-like permease